MRRSLFALTILVSTIAIAHPATARIEAGCDGEVAYVFVNGLEIEPCDSVLEGDHEFMPIDTPTYGELREGDEYRFGWTSSGLIGARTHRKGFEHETDVDPPLYITSPMVLYLTWPMLIGGGIVVLGLGAGLAGSRRKQSAVSSVSTESEDRAVGATAGVE